MKILVTGAGGYLGSTLVGMLLARGHHVTAVDTFEHGPTLAHCCWSDDLDVVKGDLTNAAFLRELMTEFEWDAVIHLAAIVGAAACDEQEQRAGLVNERVTGEIAMRLPLATPLLYPCTNSGYGIGGAAECTEESPLNPLTLYGRTKVQGELYVMHRENSVSLRLATLFGWSPRMRRDLLVNDMVWRSVRDRSAVIFEGGFRRNFCHVRDAAMAFVHVLGNWDKMKGQIYNVGDTRANMTKLDLCAKIQDHVPEFRFLAADHASDPDKRDYVVSNKKIEATGWAPRHSLDDGIAELIRGYEMMRREQYGNV